jgi:hypothetical protein
MRFINGLILGIILTIGTAYIVDTMHAAPGPDDKGAPQRMVNWGVVSDNLGGLSSDLQVAWARIVGGAKDLDKHAERSGT